MSGKIPLKKNSIVASQVSGFRDDEVKSVEFDLSSGSPNVANPPEWLAHYVSGSVVIGFTGNILAHELALTTVIQEYDGTQTTPFELTIAETGFYKIFAGALIYDNSDLDAIFVAVRVNFADFTFSYVPIDSDGKNLYCKLEDAFLQQGDTVQLQVRARSLSGDNPSISLADAFFQLKKA